MTTRRGWIHVTHHRGLRAAGLGGPAKTASRAQPIEVEVPAGGTVLLAAAPGVRAEALTAMLRNEGYRVVVVGDGFELLNAWTFAWLTSSSGAQPFEVIVVAGAMPLLSCSEAILELRRFSDCQAVCVATPSSPSEDSMALSEVVRRVRSAFMRESLPDRRAFA